MVEQIRRFLGYSRRIAIGARNRELGRLLPELLQPEVAIFEKPAGVTRSDLR